MYRWQRVFGLQRSQPFLFGVGMFSNVDKQITILQGRGMIIDNNSINQNILIDNNYYNVINGFKAPFLDSSQSNETYKKGTKFEELFSLYRFDRKLRNLILEYSLIIENSLKTKIAYEFSNKYGEYDYLKKECFVFNTNDKKKKNVENLIESMGKKINREKDNPIYKHFVERDGNIPIWAAMSFFDFGITRSFYQNLDEKLRYEIANYFNISMSQLITFLSTINMFRNVCAHDNRIMNYQIYNKEFKIMDMPIHKNMNLKKEHNEYVIGKNDLFSLFISFKYLLSEENFDYFYHKLGILTCELGEQLSTITLKDVYFEYRLPQEDLSIKQKSWKNINLVSKK